MSLHSTRRLSRRKPEETEGSDDKYYVNIILPHDHSLKGIKAVKDLDNAPDDPSPIFWPHGWDSWPPKIEGDKLIHR